MSSQPLFPPALLPLFQTDKKQTECLLSSLALPTIASHPVTVQNPTVPKKFPVPSPARRIQCTRKCAASCDLDCPQIFLPAQDFLTQPATNTTHSRLLVQHTYPSISGNNAAII